MTLDRLAVAYARVNATQDSTSICEE